MEKMEHCRKCKDKRSILSWHQAYGMRLVRTRDDGVKVYDVECKKCGRYEVKVSNVKRWKRSKWNEF